MLQLQGQITSEVLHRAAAMPAPVTLAASLRDGENGRGMETALPSQVDLLPVLSEHRALRSASRRGTLRRWPGRVGRSARARLHPALTRRAATPARRPEVEVRPPHD